jgi:hypothetical protein
MSAPFATRGDEALALEDAQDRGHGGVRERALDGQRRDHLRDIALAQAPQNRHELELDVRQSPVFARGFRLAQGRLQ